MKTASILCVIAASLCLSPVAISQRTLDEAETEDILRQLTSKSYTTWVAAGTIEVDRLISRRIGLDALPDAVANPPRPGDVKVLVVPGWQ